MNIYRLGKDHEKSSTRFHSDRINDRDRHHRHSGVRRAASLFKLYNKAAFSEIIIATSALKADIEVCSQRVDTTNANYVTHCIDGGGFGVNDPAASAWVASITTASPAADQVASTATADADLTPAGPTYIVTGTRDINGQVLWDDSINHGSCLAASLC